MTEGGTEFAESLLKTIRSGRSFGGHPLWFFDGMDRAFGGEVRA